jgi:hypothetical protein
MQILHIYIFMRFYVANNLSRVVFSWPGRPYFANISETSNLEKKEERNSYSAILFQAKQLKFWVPWASNMCCWKAYVHSEVYC